MRRGGIQSKRPGGGCLRPDGYVICSEDGIPKMEHVIVAERALGKELPAVARVHHFDEIRSNNVPTNLVICPDEAYHRLLHQRQRAFDVCGHADWRLCTYCKTYAPLDDLYCKRKQAWHRKCRNNHDRSLYQRKSK